MTNPMATMTGDNDEGKEAERKDLLDELSNNAQVMSEFQMLKWLEENRARLNKHGIWMKEEREEHETIMEEFSEIERLNNEMIKAMNGENHVIKPKYPEDFISEAEEQTK